jgi:hypothetical protein
MPITRGKPTIAVKLTAGTLGMLQTPVAEDISAVGKAATAETLAITDNPGKNQQRYEYINSRADSMQHMILMENRER